ncbi:type II toxin-antitoxin system mRNA interferase toxin, RelE/StbE family [Serratia sp. 14-2641]|uniref:type II toxin-antitoxin system RelE/ParE family toxin n=1 Tax=Serratia sp. 14-2641 TaxID=1841657 RepID=UPI00080FA224|nr:type II toxin-antitoxin system mRNA interferase toxin, RelE/StbE family [Serratia sp. 14-2641]OCJ36810.1 addiction module antitoxin [Serratia sp. 14-2641]
MLPIIWSQSARSDLANIIRYIANENPFAARRIKALIQEAIQPAAEHPYLFRVGRLPGTREVVAHPNYILVYQINAERITVLSVLHARQEYP